MEFNEYRDILFTKCQNTLIKLCWFGAIFILIVELLVFVAFLKTDFLTVSVPFYLIVRIAIPSTIDFITAIFCSKIVKSNRFTVFQKSLASGLFVCVICGVVSIFHNYYKFLLAAAGLPIVVCSIFADKKVLSRITSCSVLIFCISAVTMWFDDTRIGVVDYTTNVICSAFFLVVLIKVAVSLVVYQIEQINFIYSSNQSQTELIHELNIEPHTKLYNRTALNAALISFVRKFHSGLIKPHLVLVDIDNFRNIKEKYGPVCGEQVINALVEILKRNMGGIRRAFNYSSDEFVLLFEKDSSEEVYNLVDTIRQEFKEKIFDFSPEQTFTLSAGISLLQKNWDDTTWFSSADDALYKAKQNGRNRIEIAEV